GTFYVPAWKDNDGANVHCPSCRFQQQGFQPGCLCLGLNDRIWVTRPVEHPQLGAIEMDYGFPPSWLAPRLGFDGEYTTGADGDVIQVETAGDDVVEDLVAFLSKALKILPNGSLAFCALAKIARDRQNLQKPVDNEDNR